MLDRVLGYFLKEPRRLENLGSTFASIGAIIIVIGLYAHVATTASSALAFLSRQTSTVRTLAELYPLLPTWWVPESLFGGLLAVLLTAIGLWLNAIGQQIRRVLEH